MRIPFTLSKYLADPSLKVYTREGYHQARIICTDADNDYPVIAIIQGHSRQYTEKGKLMGTLSDNPSELDLFIEDGMPEPELTPFEHELGVFVFGDAHDDPNCPFSPEQKGFLRTISKDILLPLAKKDLENLEMP